MCIDEIFGMDEDNKYNYLGFGIIRDGKKYYLTAEECACAMKSLITLSERNILKEIRRIRQEKALPDEMLDSMAERYADQFLEKLPLMLVDVINAHSSENH